MSPNYIIICYEIRTIPSNIINFVTNHYKNLGNFKVLILIAILVLSVLQIITLLFYLEIFELNFCSLNKNTKRNIEERERMLSVNNIDFTNIDNESDIEIKGYIIEDNIRKTCIEMKSSEGRSSNTSK